MYNTSNTYDFIFFYNFVNIKYIAFQITLKSHPLSHSRGRIISRHYRIFIFVKTIIYQFICFNFILATRYL